MQNAHRAFWISLLSLAFASSMFGQALDQESKKEVAEQETQQDEGFSNSDLTVRRKEAEEKRSKKRKGKNENNKKPTLRKKPSLPANTPSGNSTVASKKKTKVRQITLSGNYVDLVQPVSFDPTMLLLGGSPAKQKSFYKLCEFLEDLEENEQFHHVVFDLSAGSLSMNSAQLDEFSRRLEKLRGAGKKTYAWLENASNVHLAIAACCDEVFLADLGSVDMPSLAMQSIFYRDAMDLFGVKASVVRAGDFKGAVEPFINAKMSVHLRDHYVQMLETMNDALVDRLSKGRGMKRATIRNLQAKRAVLPKDALADGLVDYLAPYGSMRKTISAHIDKDVDWVTPKQAARRQVNVFQLMGQMMSGPASSSRRLRDNTIVVLHLSGTIIDGKRASSGSIVSGPTVDLIEKLTEEEKVKGVVVRINSPGGSATASEAVRQALAKLADAKPCVVSMGNMAASGGYWISCIDAPVYAEKGTLTGSIGVFSMKLSAGALMRRVGIHMEAITLDDSAAVFALDRPWSDEDNESLQEFIDFVYSRFLALVSETRGIKAKKLKKLAGGRVWSGTQAKQNKLVDHLGGVDDCLVSLSKRAKLKDFHVIHRPVARTGIDLSELLGSGNDEQILSSVPQAALRLIQQRGISLATIKLLLQDALSNTGRPTTWALTPAEFSIR